MPNAPLSPVDWSVAVRLIGSQYPPIGLFEDLADSEDWELLAVAEARANPRIAATIGNLDLVPARRRVSGPGASYVIAPFTHCSPDRPGRFRDGSFGAYYAARNFEAAVAEVTHHQSRRLADSRACRSPKIVRWGDGAMAPYSRPLSELMFFPVPLLETVGATELY